MRINKLKTGIVLMAAFLLLTEAKAQIATGYQVATWSQFKTAAISYTFDDNCSNQLPVAMPLFDQYNYKITFNTVINWSPNWAGLLKASNNGHEIASHTVTHTTLNTLSIADQDTELKQSQSTINSNITNAKCVTVAYPNCVIGDLATIQKYYIAGRICSNAIIPGTPSDFYNISSIITGNTGSVQTAANLNSKVDAAKTSKGWCVFLTHGIDNDGGYSPTQSSEIKTHLTYVNTNTVDFWVATFGNVVKYIKERNASSLTETTITGDSLKLVVADNLDNTIYNVPITVRRVLPSGWQNPKVYMNGKLATSALSVVSGTTYIVFDVVPDQGNVYLANTKITTAPPTVSTPVNFCMGANATALSATGTALKWYTALTGGILLAAAPIPNTTTAGTINYYVTQTLNGIESNPRTLIAVTVNPIPSAPTFATQVTYCQNSTAAALTATGTALKWYTVSAGGTGSATAITPSTAAIGTINYYVSQTINGCESARAARAVAVKAIPSAPAVSSPVTYCQNSAAAALTATGTALKWYTVFTGGTGSATAITPSTAAIGTINYYVSQTINGCESARAVISVTINTAAIATITATGATTFCQGGSVILTANTGSSYIWFNGASPVSTNSMYTASIPGNYTVQVNNPSGCQGQVTSQVTTVTVNSLPAATIIAGGAVTFCQGGSVVLTASPGSSYIWFNGTTIVGVNSSYTATTSGNYTVEVTNASNCKATSSATTVTVNALPAASISAEGSTLFCEGGSVMLTANTGSSYIWFNGTSQVSTNSTYIANTSGNYSVQVTNASNCQAASPVTTVTVNQLPVAIITTSGPTTINQGGSVVLSANTGTGLTYQWFNGASQVGTGSTYTAATAGNYIVEATNAFSCKATSDAVSVIVNNNQPPTINVTTPADNSIFTSPANIILTAVATDPDGTITKVDFYNGTILVGTDPNSPYNFAMNNLTDGSYTITAIATDNNGATTTSSAIGFTVNAPVNQLPAVSITSPVNGSNFVELANLVIDAIASDADGTVSYVEFYNGTTLLGNDVSTPYSFVWSNVSAGDYQITVRATDNNGGVNTSTAVNIRVTANQPSVITIISPADNSTTMGTSVNINVTVTDPDGSIAIVEYFDGTTLIGSSTSIPYSYTWNNPTSGIHEVTVRVTDSNGGVTTSLPSTVTVQTLTGIFFSSGHSKFNNVYPNPSQSAFNIKASLEIKHLWVVNMYGVQVSELHDIPADHLVEIGKDLSVGTYMLMVEYESDIKEVIKIVKIE
jgi:hypothetical protein